MSNINNFQLYKVTKFCLVLFPFRAAMSIYIIFTATNYRATLGQLVAISMIHLITVVVVYQTEITMC